MSDDGVFTLANFKFAIVLSTMLLNAYVQGEFIAAKAIEQASQGAVEYQADRAPALLTVEDARNLAVQIAEAETLTHSVEAVNTRPAEILDDAPLSQGQQKLAEQALDDALDAPQEFAKMLAEAKDGPDQDPEVVRELQEAMRSERETLDQAHEEKREAWTEQKARQVDRLDEMYGDSPEGVKFQEEFSKVAQAIEKRIDDEYGADVKNHEDKWNQKFQDYADNPRIVPLPIVPPDLDRDGR